MGPGARAKADVRRAHRARQANNRKSSSSLVKQLLERKQSSVIGLPVADAYLTPSHGYKRYHDSLRATPTTKGNSGSDPLNTNVPFEFGTTHQKIVRITKKIKVLGRPSKIYKKSAVKVYKD